MDTTDCLNILEQRPVFERVTNNIAICFEPAKGVDTDTIIKALQSAHDGLIRAFPWVAGQIINEGRDVAKQNTGVFKIVPSVSKPKILVKDHRRSTKVPSMRSLQASGYPMAMLCEAIFAPRPSIRLVPPKVNPVLLIQVTLIPGGLVLVFSGAHTTFDGPGQGHVIRWFAKAFKNEVFSSQELEAGNMQRRDLIPLLDSGYQPGKELEQQIPSTPTTTGTSSRAPCTWISFAVPASAVRELKATATATCTSKFVSTDDAICAFLWQSITLARMGRLDPEKLTTAHRAINARQMLGIPGNYPGLVLGSLYHKFEIQELVRLPLGIVASAFRDAITCPSPTVAWQTRAIATVLSRSTDKDCLRVGAKLDLSSDLLFSTSVSAGAYHLDLGPDMGSPKAFRGICDIAYEGVIWIFPTRLDGSMELAMCLRTEDIANLLADESFTRYAQCLDSEGITVGRGKLKHRIFQSLWPFLSCLARTKLR